LHSEIKSLETANTTLQDYFEELDSYYMQQINIALQTNEKEEVARFIEIIEPIKDENKHLWFQMWYKALFETYDNLDDLPETPYDVFSDDEIELILKCIETEAHECDFDSKVNVASVILNRVEHDEFPTDPVEIITAPNQFAYSRSSIADDTIEALLYAFMIEDTTNGCIAFRSDNNPQEWNGWTLQFSDNAVHYFYK
jgi:hypothetical protein